MIYQNKLLWMVNLLTKRSYKKLKIICFARTFNVQQGFPNEAKISKGANGGQFKNFWQWIYTRYSRVADEEQIKKRS